MWILHPTRQRLSVSRAPLYPTGGGRSFEESIPEYVQDSGEYHLTPTDGLPECPFILTPNPTESFSARPISISLHVHAFADLAEFSVLYEATQKIDQRLTAKPFVPGRMLQPRAAKMAEAARGLLLKVGTFLVVEREVMTRDDLPMIFRLERLSDTGSADGTLFCSGSTPQLAKDDVLWRRILPDAKENSKFREVQIGTVISG
jgi:hypothetical protein